MIISNFLRNGKTVYRSTGKSVYRRGGKTTYQTTGKLPYRSTGKVLDIYNNLDILGRYIKDESIDLIYLDPPFKSNQDYNVLFKERNGTQSSAQIKAFEDTWHWDRMAEDTYVEIVEELPQRIANLIKATRSFLGENDMMAYLVMMAIRLQELHRVLKSTGSIYLHCDPTASHYLRLVMDAIFGVKNFRNEIVWCYDKWISLSKAFRRNHDIIFRYSKTSNDKFNIIREIDEKRQKTLDRGYTTNLLHNGERQLIVYKGSEHKENIKVLIKKKKFVRVLYREPEGNPIKDWWVMNIIHPKAKERLGYPTQKPEALLERIVKASSSEGDVVMDAFCGCGTTIAVAEKLKRKWIGIDITHLAISLMRHRLEDSFGNEVEYKVIGEPVDLKGAEELAEQDRYQFQWWALGLIGARPAKSEQKKGADEGIDGYIYFHDDPKKKETKEVIIQVKSGNANVSNIRDLRGVVKREEAQIGVFITLREPTKPMQVEAVSSGYYRSPLGHNYPKIQILTIQKLLEGKRIDYPVRARGTDATFRKAERHKEEGKQKEMF